MRWHWSRAFKVSRILLDAKEETRCYRLREFVQRQMALRQTSPSSPFRGGELSLESSCPSQGCPSQLLVTSRNGHVISSLPGGDGQLGNRCISILSPPISWSIPIP